LANNKGTNRFLECRKKRNGGSLPARIGFEEQKQRARGMKWEEKKYLPTKKKPKAFFPRGGTLFIRAKLVNCSRGEKPIWPKGKHNHFNMVTQTGNSKEKGLFTKKKTNNFQGGVVCGVGTGPNTGPPIQNKGEIGFLMGGKRGSGGGMENQKIGVPKKTQKFFVDAQKCKK